MRQRRTGCPFRARLFALVLRTGPKARPPGHLAGGQLPASLAAKERQASGPAHSGTALRQRLRRFVHVAQQRHLLPCRAGFFWLAFTTRPHQLFAIPP